MSFVGLVLISSAYTLSEDRHILFVSCSATIANPKVHMSKIFCLTSEEIVAITKDGAPSGAKDFLVWNPPYIDEQVPSLGRYSSITEATGLMRFLMKRGIRVILFCKVSSPVHLDVVRGVTKEKIKDSKGLRTSMCQIFIVVSILLTYSGNENASHRFEQ